MFELSKILVFQNILQKKNSWFVIYSLLKVTVSALGLKVIGTMSQSATNLYIYNKYLHFIVFVHCLFLRPFYFSHLGFILLTYSPEKDNKGLAFGWYALCLNRYQIFCCIFYQLTQFQDRTCVLLLMDLNIHFWP